MYHSAILHAFGDYAAMIDAINAISSLQGSMDSFASAAERQGSFTTQASSRADSFHNAHSRRDSFASASSSGFPASGSRLDTGFDIPPPFHVGGGVQQLQQAETSRVRGLAERSDTLS